MTIKELDDAYKEAMLRLKEYENGIDVENGVDLLYEILYEMVKDIPNQ